MESINHTYTKNELLYRFEKYITVVKHKLEIPEELFLTMFLQCLENFQIYGVSYQSK